MDVAGLPARVEGRLARGRAAAAALMLDAGKALRPTGGMEYIGGKDVQAVEPLLGSDSEPVRCKIKPPRTAVHEAEAGGRTVVTVPGELHLPATPENARLVDGDLWEMTAVSVSSLSRVGRRYRVKGEVDGTLVTACRYTVERVTT